MNKKINGVNNAIKKINRPTALLNTSVGLGTDRSLGSLPVGDFLRGLC